MIVNVSVCMDPLHLVCAGFRAHARAVVAGAEFEPTSMTMFLTARGVYMRFVSRSSFRIL